MRRDSKGAWCAGLCAALWVRCNVETCVVSCVLVVRSSGTIRASYIINTLFLSDEGIVLVNTTNNQFSGASLLFFGDIVSALGTAYGRTIRASAAVPHAHAHAHAHSPTHAPTHAHTHTHTHTQCNTQTHSCDTHTHTHARAHTRVCAHTQPRACVIAT